MAKRDHSKQVIGLCGAIGSGKSLVRKCIEVLWEVPTYDCDHQAKQLYHEPTVRRQITALVGFDPIRPDGSLDKCKLREALATDKEGIEKIVHTALFAHLTDWIEQQPYATVVIESALLFTSGLYHFCTRTIAVLCDDNKRMERVLSRNPDLSDKDFAQIDRLQTEERTLLQTNADYHLYNNEKESIITQLETIYNQVTRNS